MSTINLIACPFCGGACVFNQHDNSHYWSVLCTICFANSAKYSSKIAAATAWNRRAKEK